MTSDNRGGPRKGRPDDTDQPPSRIAEGPESVDQSSVEGTRKSGIKTGWE